MDTVHLGNPLPTARSHHSFVNAVHVVHVQLQLLERLVGRRGALRDVLTLCDRATSASKAGVSRDAAALQRFGSTVLDAVRRISDELAVTDEATMRETLEIVDILIKGLLVTELRLQQLFVQTRDHLDWESRTVESVVSRIQEDLGVLCMDRRFSVVYSREEHDERTHLVELAVTSSTLDRVMIPSILVRLLAYLVYAAIQRTKPGGRVAAALMDDESYVTGTVGDSGRPLRIEALDERLSRIAESGDIHGEPANALDAPVAIAAAVAARVDGECSVEVGEDTRIRLTIPRRAVRR